MNAMTQTPAIGTPLMEGGRSADSLRAFLAAGGRILIGPDGAAETSIDGGAIFGVEIPAELAAQRHHACLEFLRRYRHGRGARLATRAARMLGSRTDNGWRVLAGA